MLGNSARFAFSKRIPVLQLFSQGVWCGCLAAGTLAGTPHEASGILPRWKPVVRRRLTDARRAFFAPRRPGTDRCGGERLPRAWIAIIPDRDRQGDGPDFSAPPKRGSVEGVHVPSRLMSRHGALFGRFQGNRLWWDVTTTLRVPIPICTDPHPVPVRPAVVPVCHHSAPLDVAPTILSIAAIRYPEGAVDPARSSAVTETPKANLEPERNALDSARRG